MRTRWIAVVAMIGMVGLAAGCGGVSGSANTQSPPDTSLPSVRGRTFVSSTVVGHRLVAGTHVQISFGRDQGISVNAGCNSFGAASRVEDARLVVAELAGTEMGCDAGRMAQDQWIAGLLQAKPGIVTTTDGIRLTSGATTLTLRDRKIVDPDRPLVATMWIVESEIERSTVSSLAPGTSASVQLVNRTRIEVYDGCTHAAGVVEMHTSSFTVRDLVGTSPGTCAGRPALGFGRVFPGTVRFEIDAARLTLTAPDGLGLGFHAKAG